MRQPLAFSSCNARRTDGTTIARVFAVVLAIAMSACGGSNNPGSPSSGNGSSTGSTTSNKTVTVTIDGVAFVPTLVTAVRSNPGVEMVTIVATNSTGASGTTTTFAAPTQV